VLTLVLNFLKLISIKKELDEGLQMILITKPFSMFGHTRNMCTLKAHFFSFAWLDNAKDGDQNFLIIKSISKFDRLTQVKA